MGRKSLRDGVLDPAFVDVHYRDERAAGLTRHRGDEKTDCAGADYEGCGAGGDGGAIEGVDCYAEGF